MPPDRGRVRGDNGTSERIWDVDERFGSLGIPSGGSAPSTPPNLKMHLETAEKGRGAGKTVDLHAEWLHGAGSATRGGGVIRWRKTGMGLGTFGRRLFQRREIVRGAEGQSEALLVRPGMM